MIRPVVLAVVALLLTVGQASAECAWVLWSVVLLGPTRAPVWTLHEAYSLEEACRSRQGQEQKAWTEAGDKEHPDDKYPIVGWRCFPDTVDPRGAEERGR